MLDANHQLQADYHKITNEPKPAVEGKLFTCKTHDGAELKNFCMQDGEFFCQECIDDHYDHDLKKNRVKHTEESIK